MKKVLWVKFGWSDYYRGGFVDGNFSWLNDNKGKKNDGRGHEAFNFNAGPDGTYYCYVPPQSKDYAPSSHDPEGWTVICLAKNPRHTGIHVVGWYENATLHGQWLEPPDSIMKKRGDTAHPAYDWSYCITSKTAYFIPPESRNLPFSDASIRQGKYSFLAGPEVESNDNKRRVLKLLEGRLKTLTAFAIKNPGESKLPDPELDSADPLKGFGTPEHRKEVEKAAERVVIEHYETKGYTCKRVTHIPCGYDFVFAKGKSQLHVEVKGTSGSSPRFFLTRNEYTTGLQLNPAWRLAMVTSALSTSPSITMYTATEIQRAFELEPYVYMGKLIPKPECSQAG
ncbi:DUF3883 domain-containing protein [Pseudomonas lutea]|uniref:DUF3883 domain-containing protein n=1 Tax=Pseudomonas lutea TaxID=243924 RepID=A0ABR9A825_9PSED|nr:DUF3883 domain-containing protein [Pseudomonas lutea]